MSEHNNPIDRRAQQKERMDELRAAVAQGVQDVFAPDKYRAFLHTISHFPDHSFNNQMLIALQRPGATKMQTYGEWEKQDRHVAKGEKGSRIVRPNQTYKTVDGKPTTRTYYNITTVFDAAQTTGKPLPETMQPSPHTLMEALKKTSASLDANTPADAIQQLAAIYTKEKEHAELMTGSVAYAVGQRYGLPMETAQIQPVIAWAQNQEPADRRALLESISKTAGNFIVSIDHHIRMMQLEQDAQEKLATEWLYNLDDSVLVHIDTSDMGFNYTIYSAHGGDHLDGGLIDAGVAYEDVLPCIIAAHELPQGPVTEVSRQLLEAIHDEKLPEALNRLFMEDRTDSFAIYQLRDTEENTNIRFMSYDYVQQQNQPINHSRYELRYASGLAQDPTKTLADHLNYLYYRFNQDRPEDFKGHSLSVSDVVAIRHQGELTCMYVDSFGFKPLPDFYADNPLRTAEMSLEDDMNLLDGRINNGRSDAVKADLPEERRPSVHEQLRRSPVHAGKPKKGVQSHAEMEH